MTPSLLAGARVYLTEVDPGTGPLAGNVGLHVGDDPALVRRRREALARLIGRDVVWMDQTHSTRVEVVVRVEGAPRLAGASSSLEAPAPGEWGPVRADGIVIDARGWVGAPGLAVQTADCLPVVLAADGGRVVAAVHAGRRGLLGGILTRAVDAIRELADGPIDALIGPAICGSCYEVPAQMVRESEAVVAGIGAVTSWGTPSLDLPRAAAALLADADVCVEIDPRCTLEDGDLFSYRADPACGRQALIIVPA